MIDVVIPLGNGSKYADMELRFALRGVQKHLKNYRHIFIVGSLPGWLQNVIHIPCDDPYQKEQNIMYKIYKACLDDRVSEDFFFMNDDHYLLQDVDAPTLPYYHKGNIYPHGIVRAGEPYKTSLSNTYKILKEAGHDDYHFDIHTPIVYNKIMFMHAVAQYDWTVHGSLVIKSIYCNTLKIAGEFMNDCKIGIRRGRKSIEEMVKDRWVFSTGEYAINKDMRQFLLDRFPEPSRYEIQ